MSPAAPMVGILNLQPGCPQRAVNLRPTPPCTPNCSCQPRRQLRRAEQAAERALQGGERGGACTLPGRRTQRSSSTAPLTTTRARPAHAALPLPPSRAAQAAAEEDKARILAEKAAAGESGDKPARAPKKPHTSTAFEVKGGPLAASVPRWSIGAVQDNTCLRLPPPCPRSCFARTAGRICAASTRRRARQRCGAAAFCLVACPRAPPNPGCAGQQAAVCPVEGVWR